MSGDFRQFSSPSAAVGSIVFALLAPCASGCGGAGERLKPNLSAEVAADAGAGINPCSPPATFETAQFGCTPSAAIKCLDFDGVGEGALPTGWYRYYDKIAEAPKYADPITGNLESFEPHGSGDATNATATTHGDWTTRIPSTEKHCGAGNYAYHVVSADQNVWGPQFGVKFDQTTDSTHLPAIDTADWDGFEFWIRRGVDHPELEPFGTTLFVGLIDKNTLSNQSKLDSDPPCNDSSNIDGKKCDVYGKGIGFVTDRKEATNRRVKCDPAGSGSLIALTGNEPDDASGPYYCWKHVMIGFDELHQRGFGVYVPQLDRAGILQIRFAMDIGDGANGNWNVWVDDVFLFRQKR
jgi:hypothetical protein